MSDIYLLTSVRPDLEKQALMTGCKVGLLSLLFIACSEWLLPLLEFDSLGFWSWILGGSFTGIGLYPYQKLKRHKNHPDVLKANEKLLELHQNNQALFAINWDQIESFCFLDNGQEYGLAFTFKQPCKTLPVALSNTSRKEHGVDLFLPYFSHGSYLLLENWYNQYLRDKPEQ